MWVGRTDWGGLGERWVATRGGRRGGWMKSRSERGGGEGRGRARGWVGEGRGEGECKHDDNSSAQKSERNWGGQQG
jgi:hypothetical protein